MPPLCHSFSRLPALGPLLALHGGHAVAYLVGQGNRSPYAKFLTNRCGYARNISFANADVVLALKCCGLLLDAASLGVYTSVMDLTTPRKSAHHPERTLRAFEAVGLSPSLRQLNRNEVAEVLDVSLKFLDRLVRDGHIKRLKMGGKVRFRLSDVEAFLTGQAVA